MIYFPHFNKQFLFTGAKAARITKTPVFSDPIATLLQLRCIAVFTTGILYPLMTNNIVLCQFFLLN